MWVAVLSVKLSWRLQVLLVSASAKCIKNWETWEMLHRLAGIIRFLHPSLHFEPRISASNKLKSQSQCLADCFSKSDLSSWLVLRSPQSLPSLVELSGYYFPLYVLWFTWCWCLPWKKGPLLCLKHCQWASNKPNHWFELLQSTLHKPAPLTIRGVFKTMKQIASEKGNGSALRKQRAVMGLLRSARYALLSIPILQVSRSAFNSKLGSHV